MSHLRDTIALKPELRCYMCRTEFDQKREIGEYARCPKCGSQDIVENKRPLSLTYAGDAGDETE